jgi:hypothetical protein
MASATASSAMPPQSSAGEDAGAGADRPSSTVPTTSVPGTKGKGGRRW